MRPSLWKKVLLMSTSFIFILVSFFSTGVLAQEAQSNAQTDKFTTCLKNRVDPATGKAVPDTFLLTWHDPPSPQSLKKYLTGNFHPVSTVYAIACKGTDQGKTCSTGNKANDDYLFFSDLEIQNSTGQKVIINEGAAANTDLTKIINVKFYEVGTSTEGSKQTSDSTGVVNYDTVVYGTTANSGAYSFYGIEIIKKNDIEYGVFEEGGQQQGTFEFEFPADSGTDCAKISWTHHDPYGIVFDAKSLEPLPGATVTILDKDGKKVQFPGFVNDLTTGLDGVFNYSVQAGTYSLVVTPPKGYKFESDPQLHPNAENVYVFQDTNGSFCSLYKPGERIDEIIDTYNEVMRKAPDPECRNIPLTPLGSPYVAEEPVSMFYDFNKDNLVYSFDGKVSHPLTFVSIEQDGQQLGSQKANHSGYYGVKVPVSVVSQNAPIEIVFTKADLTGDLFTFLRRFFSFDVEAATSSKIIVDPILSYVEGYAYDVKKQIVPNAVIRLKLKQTGGIYYETKANENGYFVISPSNIPTMQFTIEVVSPSGQKITYHTYEFAKDNNEYLKENKINLINATKNGKKLIPDKKTNIDGSPISEEVAFAEQQKQAAASPSKKALSNSFILTALILMLLVALVFGVVVFIKRRSTPQY